MKTHPQPHLPFYLTIFMRALQDLANDRLNTAGGMSGIPFSAKVAYCKEYGLDLDTFVEIMNIIDAEFVDATNKKIQRMIKQHGGH